MQEENHFLEGIRADPEDADLRMVYADWLEERGDVRADFVRLELALRCLPADHGSRLDAEQELSLLRKGRDENWLSVVEPRRDKIDDADALSQFFCTCLNTGNEDEPRRELELHVETQDTECAPWKTVLDRVEQAAADGRSEFAPLAKMSKSERARIVTLPRTISKLKLVKRLHLPASYLVRIPPEIGEMTSLEDIDLYMSYLLHWFPYEITRCKKLRDSRVSTRALYGNFKFRPPFPGLVDGGTPPASRLVAEFWSGRYGQPRLRPCSVCGRPFEDHGRHRVWISLRVATDILPLLVNACSPECLDRLPPPAVGYVSEAHRGGLNVRQPPTR